MFTQHIVNYREVCAVFFGVIFCSYTAAQTTGESPQAWFDSGRTELQAALALQPNTNQAKNIILFIGDGMGVSTVTAGRIYDGQSRGQPGEENSLSFEKLPYLALSKTYNTNQQTADSAGTMTAMMSGVKSKAGFIGINQIPERGDCKTALENALPTFLEQAEDAGLATGIVSTARITHATPAATYAHVSERDWEGDDAMPKQALQDGCRDIARQLIEFSHGDGIEVALGGGRRYFLPKTKNGGSRQDGRDLTEEWRRRFGADKYVQDRHQLAAFNGQTGKHLLGLFSSSHMNFSHDRAGNNRQQPNLMEMTTKALDILEQHTQGYFLMVEAGRIDHGHHAGNALRALKDTQEFSTTIAQTLARVDLNNTLVIVTADHSHTLTISGYPTRGNPILGPVVHNDAKGNVGQPAKAADNKTYTTLGYRNGPGAVTTTRSRANVTLTDTNAPNYLQQALVPLESETHGGEDVAIYAGGPWAHLFQRTHEQHYIYHVMWHAAQLSNRARQTSP